MLLTSATLADGTTADVRIEGERIVAVEPPSARPAGRDPVVDLGGRLLLPAPVEAHAHLEKTFTADFLGNDSGDLDGAVAAWYGYRADVAPAVVAARASRAALVLLAHGSTAIRTHVDVGTRTGLRLLEAMVEVRDTVGHLLDLSIVAFVDEPITGAAGAGNRAVLHDALSHGADVVGGAPYRDARPIDAQEALLSIAAEHGTPVDLHTDETLDPASRCLDALPAQIRRLGFAHPVAASHCVSLGSRPRADAERLAADLAATQVSVICCPATNLYLQGRDHGPSTPRGLTALGPLLAAGVTVAGGGDNVQDPFNPLGTGDPLETAALLVLAGHLTVEQAYDAVSRSARRAMGLPAVRIAPGFPADLVALPARTLREAMARRPGHRLVIRHGRIVSHPDGGADPGSHEQDRAEPAPSRPGPLTGPDRPRHEAGGPPPRPERPPRAGRPR
jgi:cytosine deaminase